MDHELELLERQGWARLDYFRERNRRAFVQLVVTIASAEASSGKNSHLSGLGLVLSIGSMSERTWLVMQETAALVAKRAWREEQAFHEVTPKVLEALKVEAKKNAEG